MYRSVRLVSSLTAALLDSLFEHPEVMSSVSTLQVPAILWASTEFFHKVLEEQMPYIRGSLSGQ